MNPFDILLLLIVAMSLGSGLMKGLVREVFSLVGVILGILVSLIFSPVLGPVLQRWIPYENAAYAAAFLIFFVAILVLSSVVAHLLTKLLEFAQLGFIDRLLGGLFGIVRGGLIGLVLALGLTLFLDAGHTFLSESRLTPRLAWGGRALAPFLPEKTREVLLDRLQDLPPEDVPEEETTI